ncbi:MAG: hypothetical protein LBI79_08525 [Nitrososphaerota archaeon]|nr:hypothetical protein [Nitrososphaerota archaeon]
MLLLIPYVIVLACAIIIISACASLISVNVAALLIMLAPLLTVSGIVAIALAIHIMHAIANRLKLIAKQYERMDLFLLLEHSSFWWLDYNSFRAFNELTDEYNMRNNVGT